MTAIWCMICFCLLILVSCFYPWFQVLDILSAWYLQSTKSGTTYILYGKQQPMSKGVQPLLMYRFLTSLCFRCIEAILYSQANSVILPSKSMWPVLFITCYLLLPVLISGPCMLGECFVSVCHACVWPTLSVLILAFIVVICVQDRLFFNVPNNLNKQFNMKTLLRPHIEIYQSMHCESKQHHY